MIFFSKLCYLNTLRFNCYYSKEIIAFLYILVTVILILEIKKNIYHKPQLSDVYKSGKHNT